MSVANPRWTFHRVLLDATGRQLDAYIHDDGRWKLCSWHGRPVEIYRGRSDTCTSDAALLDLIAWVARMQGWKFLEE